MRGGGHLGAVRADGRRGVSERTQRTLPGAVGVFRRGLLHERAESLEAALPVAATRRREPPRPVAHAPHVLDVLIDREQTMPVLEERGLLVAQARPANIPLPGERRHDVLLETRHDVVLSSPLPS